MFDTFFLLCQYWAVENPFNVFVCEPFPLFKKVKPYGVFKQSWSVHRATDDRVVSEAPQWTFI